MFKTIYSFFLISVKMTRYCTLIQTYLPYCFSAEIVIWWLVANIAWCQLLIIEHTKFPWIHNVMMDTMEVMGKIMQT